MTRRTAPKACDRSRPGTHRSPAQPGVPARRIDRPRACAGGAPVRSPAMTTRTDTDTLGHLVPEASRPPEPVREQTGGRAGEWAMQSLLGHGGAEGRVPALDGIRAWAVL